MSVIKRGQRWYLNLYLYGRLVNLRTFAASREDALDVERAILVALRSQDYSALSPVAREACIRLFHNRDWKIPDGLILSEKKVVKPTDGLTLKEAIEIFVNYPGIRGSAALKRYLSPLGRFLHKWGPDKHIKTIWVPDIRAYQAERLAEKACPSTVNKERGILSRLFRVLEELQYVHTNPCRMIERLSEKSGERQVYLSFKDFNRILEYLPEWFRPIAQTAYYTGMRKGEIVGLKRKQVDLQKRLIYLGPEDTKEGHWKRVPIHKDLLPILEEILLGQVASLSGNVFLKDSHPITKPTEMRWCWERKAAKLGLEPCPRFHDLRHAWKTNARRSGMDPEIREAILGHATRARSVNERYGRISDQEFVRAIDGMTFDHGDTEIWIGK